MVISGSGPAEADQRDRFVEIAVQIALERGTQGLTMAELASRAGVSTVQVSRHFESRDALFEAMAELWFRPKVAVMEAVLATDLPARRKLYEFFARRFELVRAEFHADPVGFRAYGDLAEEHFELIRSYIDLGDHYLGTIIAQAIDEGAFAGLEIDAAISLVNQMVACYVNITMMPKVIDKLSTDKLARIVDAMFDGLSAADRGAKGVADLRAA